MELSRAKKFLFLCLICGAWGSVSASDLDQVKRLVRVKDFAAAAELLQNLSNAGDAEADYQLGALYRSGKGVTQDYEIAFSHFLRAAEQDHAKAQFNVAVLLEDGLGTTKDSQSAQQWFERAAAQGHGQAQKRLQRDSDPLESPQRFESESEALRWWASRGDTQQVKTALEIGGGINDSDQRGQTALMLAAKFGHVATVELLLERGAATDVKDKFSDTALSLAITGLHSETARALITTGGALETTHRNGNTPLMLAAHYGLTDVVQALIQQDIALNKVNQRDENAADASNNAGHQAITALLAKHQVFPSSPVTNRSRTVAMPTQTGAFPGWTPLMIAAWQNEPEIVDRLSSGGAINARDAEGHTALTLAASRGHSKIVKKLLMAGADPKNTTKQGHNALYFAVRAQALSSVIALTQTPEKVNASQLTDLLPLGIDTGSVDLVKHLLEQGAHFNKKDAQGLTPLMHAAQKNAPEIVSVLKQHGASVSDKDDEGMTALHHAVNSHATAVVSLFLKEGVINVLDDLGRSPLHIAATGGSTQTVRTLINMGADIEGKTPSGNTAFMIAASTGNLSVAETLLSKGASINVRDRSGNTALMKAIINNHEQTVSFLLANGAKTRVRNNRRQTAATLAEIGGNQEILASLSD